MKKRLPAALLTGTALIGFAGAATAEANPRMLRARATAVLPDESSALSVGGAGLADDGDIGEQ